MLFAGQAWSPSTLPSIPVLGAVIPTAEPSATAAPSPPPQASQTAQLQPTATQPSASVAQPTASVTARRLRAGNGPDFRVPRATAGSISLDGRLAEWVGAGVPITTPTFGVERWNGRRDLSGEAWAAWDDQYLFLAVRVTDDSHVQTQRGWEMYRGDSVEFWLDADLTGDFEQAEGNADDWQFGFSPGNFNDLRPEGVIYLPVRDESRHGALRVRALPAPDGYSLEVRIPWELVGVEPVPEAAFGYDIDISDNDLPETGEEQTRVSTSPTMQWNRPTTLGNLILLP